MYLLPSLAGLMDSQHIMPQLPQFLDDAIIKILIGVQSAHDNQASSLRLIS
jgi:hypothetical protein